MNGNLKTLLRVSACSALAFVDISLAFAGQKQDKLNVILILTDDQGYGDLHCHGNPVLKTPNIDKLYSESVRFDNFHVNATSAPTRSALMTGRYARRVGVWHTVMGREFLRTDETTMAEVFSANGYRTGMFGKWHLGQNYPFRPVDRGFMEMVMSGGGSSAQMDDYWNNDRMNDHFNHNGKWEKYGGFSADAMFNAAFEYIKKANGNPFFIYLPISEPHGPLNTLPEWDKPYLEKGLNKDLANFFATITRIDYNVGRLMDFLTKMKLADNTLVIFMTDNGSANASGYYNAGMKGAKGSMYEGGHRVPCFFHFPSSVKNIDTSPRDISTLTAHIDILPTLADLCILRYNYKKKLDGKSLCPLLKNQKNWEDRIIYLDQQRRHYPRKSLSYVMMSENWRLVNGKELYEIKKDPGQKKNVYFEHPDVVAKLKESYDTYWNEFVEYDKSHYYSRAIVGNPKQKEVMLASIDLFLENSSTLTVNQASIRNGVVTNGSWLVYVEKDGMYEFELRRWPKEADTEIVSSVPEINSETNDIRLNRWGEKPEGTALDIVRARLSVNGHDVSKEVKENDKHVTFTLPLKKGNATVRSWFYDKKDKDRCVYYVYVRLKE